MGDRSIRVVALGIPRRGDEGEELLVSECYDPDPGPGNPNVFYRPLGGGVEFGEHSRETVHREFEEELSVALADVSALGTYEDVFTYDGTTHHEVWRLFGVEFAEEWPYERDRFVGYEPDLDERIDCVWKPIADFRDAGDTFYPEALLEDL